MKRFFYTLVTLSLLGFYATAQELNAIKKTNLSVQDIDFETIKTTVPSGWRQTKDINSVRAKVMIQRAQFESIYNKHNSKIEIRFYVGDKKGQEKRIMKDKDYYLSKSTSSYDMSPDEACAAPGRHVAKIWLSVRERDGSANSGYDTYEESYPFVCLDFKKLKRIDVDSKFELSGQRRDRTFDQLNLVLKVNPNQFRNIDRDNEKVELRLYTERDGNRYRINKEKTYLLKDAAVSYTFPINQLCGSIDSWDIGEVIFGKNVTVDCRLTVVDRDGDRSPEYEVYSCPEQEFECWK